MKPVVAIVGRANVGKSTLFNRLTHTKRAIVDDLAGVTRDRLYEDVMWNGKTFTLIDTGGIELKSNDEPLTIPMTRSLPQLNAAEARPVI